MAVPFKYASRGGDNIEGGHLLSFDAGFPTPFPLTKVLVTLMNNYGILYKIRGCGGGGYWIFLVFEFQIVYTDNKTECNWKTQDSNKR